MPDQVRHDGVGTFYEAVNIINWKTFRICQYMPILPIIIRSCLFRNTDIWQIYRITEPTILKKPREHPILLADSLRGLVPITVTTCLNSMESGFCHLIAILRALPKFSVSVNAQSVLVSNARLKFE